MPNSTRNVVILCFENEFEKMLLFISHGTPVALGVTIKYLRDEIKYFLGYVLFDKEAKWWTIRWELNFYTNSFCETSLKKKNYIKMFVISIEVGNHEAHLWQRLLVTLREKFTLGWCVEKDVGWLNESRVLLVENDKLSRRKIGKNYGINTN